MAMYLKWYMCACHEPLVTQNSICSNTFGRVEYSIKWSLYIPAPNGLAKSDLYKHVAAIDMWFSI